MKGIRRLQCRKDAHGRPRQAHCLQHSAAPDCGEMTCSWQPRYAKRQRTRERGDLVKRLCPLVRAKQVLQKPSRPGQVRPSHVTVEQGKQSVTHNVHREAALGCNTLVQAGVAQNRGAWGGLQTRQKPSFVLGARNAQRVERQGLSPDEQCKHRASENGGMLQFSVAQGVVLPIKLLAEDVEPRRSIQHVDWEDAEGCLHRKQYPPLPRAARRPHSSGHGVFPASHEIQNGPRSAAGSSGHNGAEQRLFLDGSYKQPFPPSSLRHEYWRFFAGESLPRTWSGQPTRANLQGYSWARQA